MIDRLLPPGVTKRLQVVNIAIGVVGLVVALFLPTSLAVKVINLVSMWTLVTAGVAGLDSARNPRQDDVEGVAPLLDERIATDDMVCPRCLGRIYEGSHVIVHDGAVYCGPTCARGQVRA